jgi:DNA-binding CsgD family transcriptional regulator
VESSSAVAWKLFEQGLARLSPAERIVCVALLRGYSAKEISERLNRSFHTVNNHTRAVFIAFRVKSRSQLMAMFIVGCCSEQIFEYIMRGTDDAYTSRP